MATKLLISTKLICLFLLLLNSSTEGRYLSNPDCRTNENRQRMNNMIDNMTEESHVPGYNFCGPGTKLAERLARGDRGINDLDEACRDHDIAYSRTTNHRQRLIADAELISKAQCIAKSGYYSAKEKLIAIGVVYALILKAKITGDID